MLFINLAVANKPGRHYWYNGHLKERRREEKDKEREIEIEREKVWRKKKREREKILTVEKNMFMVNHEKILFFFQPIYQDLKKIS